MFKVCSKLILDLDKVYTAEKISEKTMQASNRSINRKLRKLRKKLTDLVQTGHQGLAKFITLNFQKLLYPHADVKGWVSNNTLPKAINRKIMMLSASTKS
jgi:hypothetical protein